MGHRAISRLTLDPGTCLSSARPSWYTSAGRRRSGNDVFDHFAFYIGQPEGPATVLIGELGVIETK